MSNSILVKRGKIHPDDRAYIYERDEKRCLVCLDDRLDYLTIDHVVPLVKGGRNHVSNYQTLCRKCNVAKGSDYKDYRWYDEPPLELSPTSFAIPKIHRHGSPIRAYKKELKRKLVKPENTLRYGGIHPLVELACENVKKREASYGYSGSVVSYRYPDIHKAVSYVEPKLYDKSNFHVIEDADWP